MSTEIILEKDIRTLRRESAAAFQQRMERQGTFVVRLLSSPGSGKTTLLEQTARRLGDEYRVGVLVGDIATERDAERLAPLAATAQITTGGACHLELPLVEKILPQLGEEAFDFLFIEDVGNLVCPASHDLGEHFRVLVLSTTEGDDKPGKYPKAFRTSQAVVINKIDLLPYVPFSVEQAIADAKDVQGELVFFPVCALRGEGVDAWCDSLVERRRQMLTKNGGKE
ncbi:hydrogenase nickel incorporation protein HypB [Blastopirellula sp. JC732]|uniref:Hydrogenase nickel incorporation protein HypB n=1 Tax=Blastopirellula sediminis TaxID=2894196 RepID=A0A9X1ML66_9BACT|nr:hydrogenase nickel incorporation protein HypB [Blastopirellula sediminis]MCC9608342.1 hydrogenase nickel incorporation protein HypB [Blastopirellula sediminis]MCC9628881.1 hydrogenase nickel incorporation protein HypB [Blastopirellula sediminis]